MNFKVIAHEGMWEAKWNAVVLYNLKRQSRSAWLERYMGMRIWGIVEGLE